jgi:hypothetical protein
VRHDHHEIDPLGACLRDPLPRDNQDEKSAANRMRIVVGCGGGGRSP